jgi:adenosylcobinamide-GDP ribazoletransferase
MPSHQWIVQCILDLKVGAMFLTRLPLLHSQPIASGELARTLWTAPLIGGAV